MSKHATQDPNGINNTTDAGSLQSTPSTPSTSSTSTSMSSSSSSGSDSDNPVDLSHDGALLSSVSEFSSASFLHSDLGTAPYDSTASHVSENTLTRYRSRDEFPSRLSPYQLSVCEKIASDIYKLGRLTGMPLTVAYTTSFSVFELVQSFVSGFPEVAPVWINSFARYQVSPLALFVYLPLVWGELKKHVPGVARCLPDIAFLRSEQLIPLLMAAMDGATVANLSFDWLMELITIFARWAEHLPSDADVDISFWLGPTFFAGCAALGVVSMAASWIQAYNETHQQHARSLSNRIVTHWLAKATIGAINGGGVAHAALKAGFTLNGFTSQDFQKNWVQIALLAFSSSVSIASGVFFGATWHLYDKLERSLAKFTLPSSWSTSLDSDSDINDGPHEDDVILEQIQTSDDDSIVEISESAMLIPAAQVLMRLNSQDGQSLAAAAAVSQEKLQNTKAHITRYTLVLTLLSMGLIIGSFVNFLYNQKGDVDPVQSAIHARIVNFLSYFLWDGGLAAATVVAAFVLIVTKCFEKGSIRGLQVLERPALGYDSNNHTVGRIGSSAPVSVRGYGSTWTSTEPKPVPDSDRAVVDADVQSFNQQNPVLNIQ